MKKFLRKLLPTIVMLAVSATLVGTSTFAWFSMNNKVTVTGMQIKTKVSSNLLIADDEANSDSRLDDSLFKSELTQQVYGFLEPVSTTDAINFYFTNDARADGSYNKVSSEAAFIKYDENSSATGEGSSAYADYFSQVYGVTKSDAGAEYGEKAVPYVDYIFQLKASNTTRDTAQKIIIEQLNLRYKGDEPDGKAHRVAFFISDITNAAVGSVATLASNMDSSSTYKVQSSANFDREGRKPGSSATSQAVVAGPATYADAHYVDTAAALATVSAGQTKYYKVIVRLWLEGQDTTCNNQTYMALTSYWELGIKLALVNDSEGNGEAYINQVTPSSANLVNP